MATKKDLEIIRQAVLDYNNAKKNDDKAGMKAAHLKADKARGFTTTTKVDVRGNYYQSVVSEKPPALTKPVLIPQAFRNAPGLTKLTPEQQAQNKKVLLSELQGPQGKIASFTKGAAQMIVDPYGIFNKYSDPEIERADSKNVAHGKMLSNPKAVAMGLQKPNTVDVGIKYNTLGGIAASPIGVDPLAIGLTKGIQKGVQIAKGLKAVEKIPVLSNGKVKFEKLTTPTAESPLRVSSPKPELIAKNVPSEMRVQASDVTVQPRKRDLGITISQEQMFTKNGGLKSPVEQKFKDLGADTNRHEEVAMVMTDSNKAKLPLVDRIKDLGSNANRKFVDSGDTIAKIAKTNNDNGLYNLYNNAKQARKRAEYHIGEAQTDINGNAIGKSLKSIFDPIRAKGDNYYEDFQEFMYHLHNIDRMGFGKKAAQKLREFEIRHQDLANLTDKELNEILKTADPDSTAVVKEYKNLIDGVNNAPSKPVFGKSITADESRKVSQYLLQQHPEFAQEAAEVRNYLNNLMEYRIQGGLVSRETADALSEMYKNYVPTYRVNPSTMGLKTFGGNANITKGLKKATGSNKDLLPLHEQLSKQTMQAVEASHKNLFGVRLAENINPNTQQYIQELSKADDVFDIDADVLPELKNSFTIYENGQAYTMKVDDGLYEGIKALSGSDPNELAKLATAANKGFKELITSWNPMFLIRNVARDIQDTGLYSKDLSKFAKMYPGAVKEITTNGKMWQQYKALGGAGNSFFDYAKGFKKDPSWLRKNTLDRVEQLNMATEQLPRFTEFLASIEKLGHQPNYDELMQAMYNAADVTVNFGRSGTWGKTLNSTFVPFFNPAMQGTSKLIRRFTETKGVKGWTELVLKASALGVAPSLINEMVYSDDPQYRMINDREKDINFIIKIGDGEWLKFPKGRVLSLFGSAAQRGLRAAQGKEEPFAGYIKTMGDQVAPISPFESNILSPIAAVQNNKSWYGGRIEPQRLEKYSPGKRFDESTTSFSKALGGTLNYSPKKIDYLLDAYSGVIGDFAIPLSTPKVERNPFEKAFVVDSVSSNKLSQQFYDKLDETKYAKNDGGYLIANRYMNKQNKMLSDLYDEIRTIENGVGTDSYKRDKVREIKSVINGVTQNALDSLPEVQKATERLSKRYSDPDVIYREVNKEVFGAEYALKAYNKDVYEKAQKWRTVGLTYDDFYKVYFGVKDIKGDPMPNDPEKTRPNSESRKKKAYIDQQFPLTTKAQRDSLYEMAGVSKTIGHYRSQFKD